MTDIDPYDDLFSIPSMNSVIKKNMEMKDKGYHERRVYDPRKEKMTRVSYYDSGSNPSHYIRDAITGRRYNVKIGSAGENLFFKVRLALRETDQSTTLFYGSPEEHEQHFFCKIDFDLKNAWLEKRNYYEQQQQQKMMKKI